MFSNTSTPLQAFVCVVGIVATVVTNGNPLVVFVVGAVVGMFIRDDDGGFGPRLLAALMPGPSRPPIHAIGGASYLGIPRT